MSVVDASWNGLLSNYYSQKVETWLWNIRGRVVTHLQIGKIFGLSYAQASTLKTAVYIINKTGIVPINPEVFGEADFTASESTERLISAIPQPGTSLERQPTAKPPTGSLLGTSVADGLTKIRFNTCKKYLLVLQSLNTYCSGGRSISLEEPTPRSVGHQNIDEDNFGTSRKSAFETSPKKYRRFHTVRDVNHQDVVVRQLY
jgi:hypothetical protein